MNNELNNLFVDMSKEELVNFFIDCGIAVEEVEEGKGGFFLDGKEIGYIFDNNELHEVKTYITNMNIHTLFKRNLNQSMTLCSDLAMSKKFDVEKYMDFSELNLSDQKGQLDCQKSVITYNNEDLTDLEAAA